MFSLGIPMIFIPNSSKVSTTAKSNTTTLWGVWTIFAVPKGWVTLIVSAVSAVAVSLFLSVLQLAKLKNKVIANNLIVFFIFLNLIFYSKFYGLINIF